MLRGLTGCQFQELSDRMIQLTSSLKVGDNGSVEVGVVQNVVLSRRNLQSERSSFAVEFNVSSHNSALNQLARNGAEHHSGKQSGLIVIDVKSLEASCTEVVSDDIPANLALNGTECSKTMKISNKIYKLTDRSVWSEPFLPPSFDRSCNPLV